MILGFCCILTVRYEEKIISEKVEEYVLVNAKEYSDLLGYSEELSRLEDGG